MREITVDTRATAKETTLISRILRQIIIFIIWNIFIVPKLLSAVPRKPQKSASVQAFLRSLMMFRENQFSLQAIFKDFIHVTPKVNLRRASTFFVPF